MSSAQSSLYFVVPGDIDTRTGGYLYDKRIIEGLKAMDWQVQLVTLGNDYPFPSKITLDDTEQQLLAIPDKARVIVDGLAFSAAPEAFESHHNRLNIIALIHHPLALETGLTEQEASYLRSKEITALAYAKHVITTSQTTAVTLQDYRVPPHKISVVAPGTDEAPVARGSTDDEQNNTQMLCVASIIPRKGHSLLIDALRSVHDHHWHLTCAGNPRFDPENFDSLLSQVNELELSDKINFLGVLNEEELANEYDRADVFVLASYYEGYGMVFDEAIARGLPIIATTGGAIESTVPSAASILVPPGDSVQLADAIERYLQTPSLRQSLKEGALRARSRLRSWQLASLEFSKALDYA